MAISTYCIAHQKVCCLLLTFVQILASNSEYIESYALSNKTMYRQLLMLGYISDIGVETTHTQKPLPNTSF